ncbi:MAG: carbohydrate porin [Gammaproteobacteria bacterium]|nr:carbohydrate porin [Gammaproteobacteria bacterium]
MSLMFCISSAVVANDTKSDFNFALDPFERNAEQKRVQSRKPDQHDSAFPVAEEQTPAAPKPVEAAPELNNPPVQAVKPEPTATPAQNLVVTAPPSDSPPYFYTLFVDVDGVYKLQGGASQTGHGMAEEGVEPTVPSPSAIVGMAHFYGEYDTEKADLWKNGTFTLHAIFPFGKTPMNTVGDLRSVSSVDATYLNADMEMVMPQLQLLEAWYEHRFPYSRSSIRFGVGYMGTDFYRSKYSGLFLTSGVSSIGTEILWNTMASTPPNTTLGLWYKTEPMEDYYLQGVIFDGLPDHSNQVFALKLSNDEGAFLAMEGGLNRGKAKEPGYMKLGLGAWYLHQNMEKNDMVGFSGAAIAGKLGTSGLYFVGEHTYNDQIGFFLKAGKAAGDINKYRQYFTGGVVYKGLLESRPGDTAGVAVVQSKLSQAFLNANQFDENDEAVYYSHETIWELTYSTQYNKWLMLQPDLQYVIQPSMRTANKNAWVALLRAEITIF